MQFNWKGLPNQGANNAQSCVVPPLGQLLAVRTRASARQFDGLINGRRAIIECASIDEAKAELERVAKRALAIREMEHD